MSEKQTIEIEWFSTEEKLPSPNQDNLIFKAKGTVHIGYYNGEEFVEESNCEDIGSYRKIEKWAYSPFSLQTNR